MKIKPCFAINEDDKSNIIIFNMDMDELINLNETASFIFLNRYNDIESIKNLFMQKYVIENEDALLSDIKSILEFFKDNFYE